MKNTIMFFLLFITSVLFISCKEESKPRVFVFTDINIDRGDPDDRQSLVHLLWYANELTIEGIVPDRWDAQGLEASLMAIDAYAIDYKANNFNTLGYPDPANIKNVTATDFDNAKELFSRAVSENEEPLYVLIWGNMSNYGRIIREKPELTDNIRVISIGTGLMYEPHIEYLPENWEMSEPCVQLNWNGHGRNEIYNDSRFNHMWWLEINWTYNGMFTGDEPQEMYDKLSVYGEMGQHMIDITENQEWARYFRVGDTPSVLYVIDPRRNFDDPTQSSWAGKFTNPLPGERPNYYTDDNGNVEWNFSDPCTTWQNQDEVYHHSKGTLEKERPGMYKALLEKLDTLYNMN